MKKVTEKEKKSKKILDEDIFDLKEIIFSVKILSIVGVILGFIFLLLTGYYCVASTKYILNSTPEEIQNDKLTVNYISKINDYSIEDTKEIIGGIGDVGSKNEFLLIEMVVPTITVILILILIIIFSKKSFDFVRNVISNKELFTKEKLESLKKLRAILLDIFFILILAYKLYYIFIYLIIELGFEIIVYLFKNCVERENKN